MSWAIIIGLLLIAVYISLTSFRALKLSKNTTLCFTGGLGTGKTYIGVSTAVKCYQRAVFKWRLRRLLGDKKAIRPQLLSNIPIRLGPNSWSKKLTKQHLLLAERIPEYSVVFIDEIGQFASQYDYDNPYVMNQLQEFIRFFRHYVDGRFICTDQSSANIVVPIRRRLNIIYNLNNFRRFGTVFPFYKVEVSQLEVCEDSISNVNTTQTSESGLISVKNINKPYFFGYLPYKFQKGSRKYDSRCYSPRYTCDYANVVDWKEYKTTYIIDISATEDERKAYKKGRR